LRADCWSSPVIVRMGSEGVVPEGVVPEVLSLLTELEVKLEDSVFVKPAEPCEDTSPFYLSNIDQV
jgi:hypothetical protein